MATGYVLIGISILLFALSIVPNFAITNFFCGLFGLAWYAMLLIALLFGLACIMQLRYSYNKKFTAYLILFASFLVMFLHAIFSSSMLAENVGFADYGGYLSGCYNMTNGITVGGAVCGLLVYFLRAIFGIVGVYCVLVIGVAVFFGLVLDAAIYGAAKTKHISAAELAKKANTNNNADQQDNYYGKQYIQQLAQQSKEHQLQEFEEYQEQTEMHDSQDNEAIDNDHSFSATTERDNARNRLFGLDDTQNKEQSESTGVRSARDILFGNRQVPDVVMPNDEERERWMNNYKKEEDQPNDDYSSLFGGGLSSGSRLGVDADESRLGDDSLFGETTDNERQSNFGGRRGFESSSRGRLEQNNIESISIDDNTNDITSGRITDSEIEGRQAIDQNGGSDRLNRGATRDFGEATNNSPKLGEDLVDKAKSATPIFGINAGGGFGQQAGQQTAPKLRKDKQMGLKAVRYNGIPLSVFKVYTEKNADYTKEYERNTAALEKVMADFKIGAKVVNIVRGPKVTRYELSLPDGVPVSRVLSIESNIAMETEARSKIRIEAPIPGKRAFGIELENEVSSTVGMRELLESPEYINSKDPLPIAIGKDINGKVIIKSLPKMVHLLVAGSTGSGKSIFIHTLMMSILYKYSPEDVRFIMVDPKQVEFSMYSNLPHLIMPNVVCEHDKALSALKWCVGEMTRRLAVLKESECQNIDQYNHRQEVVTGRTPKMPYLVIVVDELAELMGSTMKKDFEAAIQRITQLGRAAGIHMVVATQRPSVDVITGTIKNNMPTRIAFALASFADSKTVLDEGGAEALLGKGDMLFAPQDMNIKVRLQAAFCDNDEIKNAIKYVKENNEATYDDEIYKAIYAEKPAETGSDEGSGGGDSGGMDDFMKLAVKYAMSTGKVSVSMLQRKFRIGFNRAARIVDQMCEYGLVGPSVGAKPRDFSITSEQYKELFGEDIDDAGDM